MNKNLNELLKSLKIEPHSYAFYIEAFTHHSYSYENGLKYDYQRLEFLGDAIIEYVVSQYLYNLKPKMNEGEMTKARIMIVQAQTEIKAAKQLNLEKVILLGKSISHQGIPSNILSDCYESLIGAIYLDQGQSFVTNFIHDTLISYYESKSLDDVIDYKSKFQEAIQEFGKKTVIYKVVKNEKDLFGVEL